jgi:hypothetical protein
MREKDVDMIRQWLTGGAALGLSAAAGTSLYNHLNQLAKDRQRDKRLDDDILTVKVRRPALEKSGAWPLGLLKVLGLGAAGGVGYKMITDPDEGASIGPGLAVAGGTLSLLGSYAAARKGYQALKKKRNQAILDRAQTHFADLTRAESGTEKYANMSFGDAMQGMGVGIPLLLALASGGITYKYLDKTHPLAKPARPTKPRKVVLQYVDDEDGQKKTAAYDRDSGFECLVKLVISGQKQASDLSDLVCACADGRAQELEEAVIDLGAETALDLVKGATRTLDDEELVMGTALAVRSPGLSDTVKTLACAEYQDLFPAFSKMAAAMDEEERDRAEMLVCVWEDLNRWPNIKSASQVPERRPELSKELARVLREQQTLDGPDPDTEYQLDTMGQGGAVDNGVDRSDEEDPDEVAKAMGEGAAMDDVVDQILGGLVGDKPK